MAEEFAVEQPERTAAEVNYVRETADAILTGLVTEAMEPEKKILAAYRYLMETVYFADPVGLDAWRFRSGQTELPTFVENRALSPLVFGIGSCEDFACAMVVLLEQMGFEAQYVPGFTISVDGDYVDHAWTVVRVGDNWYHLDPQLEQNVIRDGVTQYRYFLKSDDELVIDHKWGENLIAYWPDLTAADLMQIQQYTPPLCDTPGPKLPAAPAVKPTRPDIEGLIRELEAERAFHALPAIGELNTVPPVLIEGYFSHP